MTVRELLLAIYRFPLDSEVTLRAEGGPEAIARVAARTASSPEIVPERAVKVFGNRRVAARVERGRGL